MGGPAQWVFYAGIHTVTITRKSWLLIGVGLAIFSVAVWQWEFVWAVYLWECDPPPPPAQCMTPDLVIGIYNLVVGYVLPVGMVFVGGMGLLGRGPAAYQPVKDSDE